MRGNWIHIAAMGAMLGWLWRGAAQNGWGQEAIMALVLTPLVLIVLLLQELRSK